MQGEGGHPGWRAARRRWQRARRVERQFAVAMRQVARQIGAIVRGMWSGEGTSTEAMEETLRRYSGMLEPWAAAVSNRMIAEVSRRDAASWGELGRDIQRNLRQEIKTAPTGEIMRELLDRQKGLITQMPLDAEQRIRDLALSAVTGGRRWGEVASAILDQENISKARATLIARTETARASSVLTQARAQHVGSPGYWWRTSLDKDVRPMHRKLEGTFHRWSDPPVAEESGERHHPGEFPNCRCYAEPLMADEAPPH